MIIPQGVTGLGIYNAFDTSLQLIASAKFSDVQIDGIVYSSQTACVDVLAALIFFINQVEQLVLVQLQMLLIVLMVKLVL
jgi:hypothetical protein